MVPAPMIICLSTATPVAVSKLIWGWQVCDNTRDCKTEMAALRTIEDILDGSGWTDALTQADIASVVTCEGFLHASHVTKTHRAHQLLPQLYISCSRKPTWIHKVVCREVWNVPTVPFLADSVGLWTIFQFVRSLWVSNFDLYIALQSDLVPWFFALDAGYQFVCEICRPCKRDVQMSFMSSNAEHSLPRRQAHLSHPTSCSTTEAIVQHSKSTHPNWLWYDK